MSKEIAEEGILLNCPFCGSNDLSFVNYVDGDYFEFDYVVCNSCLARGGDAQSRVQATILWNVRNGV